MKRGIVFLVFGLVIICKGEVCATDLRFYSVVEDFVAYYDTESITRPSKDAIRVWVKWDYTEKGVAEYVRKYGKAFENLSYEAVLWEVNCRKKMIQGLSFSFYDNKGRVIYSVAGSNRSSDLDFIVPGSNGEFLYKAICK